MKLLDFFANSFASEPSVNALSKKSGTSAKQTSQLLSLALPLLLKYLTQNASSQSGAQSLSHALAQHTDTSSMVQQLSNADTADGNAIIQHILGSDTSQVVQSLGQQTHTNNDQVLSLLGNLAPALMSGLSAATSSAQQAQQVQQLQPAQPSGSFDFSNLAGLFGGSSSGSQGGLNLVPSSSTINSSNDGTQLIGMLLNLLK